MKKLKNKLLIHARRRAFYSFKNKPFDAEYFDTYVLSYVIKFIATTTSILTGFFFLQSLFIDTLDNTYIEYCLVILTLSLVESLKYYVTPKAFNNLFKKRIWNTIVLLIISIPLFIVSFYFTINGTKVLFDKTEQKIQVVENDMQSKIDQVSLRFDTLISKEQSKLDQTIADARKYNTIRWKTTTDRIETLEARIDTLYKRRTQALSSIKSKYSNKSKVEESESNFITTNIVYISASMETLLFLSFVFVQLYLYRSYKGSIAFRRKKTYLYSKKNK